MQTKEREKGRESHPCRHSACAFAFLRSLCIYVSFFFTCIHKVRAALSSWIERKEICTHMHSVNNNETESI
ncbi:hypothetical protein RIF29_14530 [Crotalaria pallida]|uniref:Uncharacterized protein n=1 Tax=Crotalaria pallida TaxID=3830 RepID=A0AAN9FBU9_CROPI